MVLNLLFLLLIKNLWAPPPKRLYSARGVWGRELHNSFLI